MKNTEFSYENNILTVTLSGELDHHLAAEIRGEIDAKMTEKMPRKLILDLKNIEFMDSSGLGLILGRYTKATELGCALSLKNPGRRIERLMEISGMADKIKTEKPEKEEK